MATVDGEPPTLPFDLPDSDKEDRRASVGSADHAAREPTPRPERDAPPERAAADEAPPGPRALVRAHLDALRLGEWLRHQNRDANPEEQTVLAGWTGWELLESILDESDDRWIPERTELASLLRHEPHEASDAFAVPAADHHPDDEGPGPAEVEPAYGVKEPDAGLLPDEPWPGSGDGPAGNPDRATVAPSALPAALARPADATGWRRQRERQRERRRRRLLTAGPPPRRRRPPLRARALSADPPGEWVEQRSLFTLVELLCDQVEALEVTAAAHQAMWEREQGLRLGDVRPRTGT